MLFGISETGSKQIGKVSLFYRLLALLLLAALGVRRVLLVLLALLVVLSARSSLALLEECKPR